MSLSLWSLINNDFTSTLFITQPSSKPVTETMAVLVRELTVSDYLSFTAIDLAIPIVTPREQPVSRFPPILFSLMNNFKGIPNPSRLRNSPASSLPNSVSELAPWARSQSCSFQSDPSVLQPLSFWEQCHTVEARLYPRFETPPLKLLLWEKREILFQL